MTFRYCNRLTLLANNTDVDFILMEAKVHKQFNNSMLEWLKFSRKCLEWGLFRRLENGDNESVQSFSMMSELVSVGKGRL